MTRSILLVDDDASFRAIAIRILESWGYEAVEEAGSAAEAVQRTHDARPDTVIVDIGLADGDGLTLTRTLAALPWAVRVLVVSSDSDLANQRFAQRAGAS